MAKNSKGKFEKMKILNFEKFRKNKNFEKIQTVFYTCYRYSGLLGHRMKIERTGAYHDRNVERSMKKKYTIGHQQFQNWCTNKYNTTVKPATKATRYSHVPEAFIEE